MKKGIFLSITLLIAAYANTQEKNDTQSDSPQVRVKDWNSHTMTIIDGVWDNIKQEIIEQIGEKEYLSVRNNYDWKSVPDEMSIFPNGKKKDLKAFHKKLSTLSTLYKIATYTHYYQGKDWGKYVILKVPYKGNEGWDKAVKWDTVYMILKEEDVEELRNTGKQ